MFHETFFFGARGREEENAKPVGFLGGGSMSSYFGKARTKLVASLEDQQAELIGLRRQLLCLVLLSNLMKRSDESGTPANATSHLETPRPFG